MDALTLLMLSTTQPNRAMVYEDNSERPIVECAQCSFRKNDMVGSIADRADAFAFTRLVDGSCPTLHCEHCNARLEFE